MRIPMTMTRGWKLQSSDAPSRVDHIESAITLTGGDFADVNYGKGNFTPNTVFVWLPDFSERQLATFDGTGAASASVFNTITRNIAPTGSPGYYTVPSSPNAVDIAGTGRVAPLAGSCALSYEFGSSSGVLRIKRFTAADSIGTVAELAEKIRTAIHGVSEITCGGSGSVSLKAGLQNKGSLGEYAVVPITGWNYADRFPLSGWAWSFTAINSSPNMPKPLLRVHSEVLLQRELLSTEAYLEEDLRTVDMDQLSRYTRGSGDPRFSSGAKTVRGMALSANTFSH